MADHIDGDVLAISDEEPIILDPVDLRGYSSPAAPPSGMTPDTEFYRQDALFTQRSNLRTSFQPQPAMVRIVERASMNPYVRTDESGHRVGSEGRLPSHHLDGARSNLEHLHRRNTPTHLRGRRGAQGRTGGIRRARPGPVASPIS